MDKLEEYIRNNREDFDRYNPSTGIWKKVQKRIDKGIHTRRKWFSIAAMIVVFIGITIILYRYGNRNTDNSIVISSSVELIPDGSQLYETEIYYNNLVSSLYQKATPLLIAYPEIASELTSDFGQLDSIFLEVKKDLKDNIANQEVVEAMIQNYRIKIHLLEEILQILNDEKENPGKNTNHEL